MKKIYLTFTCFLLLIWSSYGQGNDVIFLIDNSASVDNSEYVAMNTSIQNVITEVLDCNAANRIAVVQYATEGSSSKIYIETDFTDTPMVFNRYFTNGGANAHRAVGLLGKALDNIFDANILGTSALNQTSGNSLVIYLFTDDARSGLVNSYPNDAIGSNIAFQNYTNFKNLRGAKFVVTIVSPSTATTSAAAAIASYDIDALYTGTVESYPADPDGPGVGPRFLLNKNDFNLTATEIDNITNNICSCSTDISGVFFNPSTGSFQWNDTAENYIVEAINTYDCIDPNRGAFGGPATPTILASITTTDNFVDAFGLMGAVGNHKEYMWRVKTECGDWTDWCCFDGNNATSVGNYPYTYTNGTCFFADQPCEGDYNLSITQAVLSGENVEEQASNLLTATNTINAGAVADYRSNNQVILQSGFHAKSGSLFIAHIVECDVAGRPARAKKRAKPSDLVENNNVKINVKNSLKITPNPSSSKTEISLEGQLEMNTILVTSMDGRVMFNKTINSNSYKIDISSYYNGIYVVTVLTIDGSVITGKIIKE